MARCGRLHAGSQGGLEAAFVAAILGANRHVAPNATPQWPASPVKSRRRRIFAAPRLCSMRPTRCVVEGETKIMKPGIVRATLLVCALALFAAPSTIQTADAGMRSAQGPASEFPRNDRATRIGGLSVCNTARTSAAAASPYASARTRAVRASQLATATASAPTAGASRAAFAVRTLSRLCRDIFGRRQCRR